MKILIVLLAVMALCLVSTASAQPVVSITPQVVNAELGDVFTIDITVDPVGTEVYGAQCDLYFDNSILSATDQTQGTFLSQNGDSTFESKNKINNTIGKIMYGETILLAPSGVTAPGILASITFEVIGDGTSDLDLENAVLSDSYLEEIDDVVTNDGVCIIKNVTTMLIEPSHQDVSYGDVFTVNVTVDPKGEPVYAAQYKLLFDTTLLDVIAQTPGDFLSQDASSTNVEWNALNNTTGETTYKETRIGDVGGVTSRGTLTSITFKVIGSAETGSLNLNDVVISNPTDHIEPILAHNATYTVSSHVSADSISIMSAEAEYGAIVQVPVNINNVVNGPIQAIKFDVLYNHSILELDYNNNDALLNGDLTTGADWTFILGTNEQSITLATSDQSEAIQNGLTGSVVLLNFTVLGTAGETTSLELSDIELSDPSGYNIGSAPAINGTFTVAGGAEPQKPFLIYGYVWYESGAPCNNPSVSITNMDTSVEWTATTGTSSNCYQIMLTSGVDLNATEVLRFNSTDGTDFNVTDHIVTADEIDDGGLFDFNLTLESIDPSPSLVTYTITNTTISPDGDGIMDDTEIDVEFSESVDAAIRIEDATGVIKTLYTDSGVTDPDPQIWDGTDEGGNIVADGTYQVNVAMDDGVNPVVHDTTGSITVETPVDPSPSLVTYTITNTTISPDGDGIMDDTEIDVEFSESVDAAIRIEDATGVIKTLYTDSGVTDPDPQTWDGTDDSNNIVADGTYQVNVTMDDGVNPVVYDNTESITVTTPVVDPSPSLVTYTITNTTISPNGDGTEDDTKIDVEFSEPVDATILIEDATGVIKTLYTGSTIADPNPQTWDGTDDSNNIVADGTYQVNVTMDDGVNPVVYDNTRSIVVDVVVIDPEPSLVTYTITNTTISPNGDGIEDDTKIHVKFSEFVAATIKIENATGVIRALYTSSSVKNPNPQTWDGTDDSNNVVADGTYQVNVTMDDGVNPVVYDNTRSIAVEIAVTDPEPSLVTYTISNTVISPNGDGIMDDTEIDVKFSEPVTAAIRIEDATGIIKTLYTGSDVTDPDPLTWDGTDDSNNIVADGTYQVNVTMDDGVNQAVYDNTRSIRVRTGPEVEVDIGCGIIYPYPYPGCGVSLPITLRGITDYGAGTVNLYYDASVVEVSDVTGSEDSSVESWNIITPGWLMISALNTTGVSGDVVFANVVFNSVGNIGECSYLNLTVHTLGDIHYEELPYFTTNCSICIGDPYAPIVSKPSANPDTILNDNGRVRVPGTNVSVLSVIVTDADGIASVTINLSPIWGPGNDSVPMTNVMGTDQWTVKVNAPYDAGVGQVHNLVVNATDLSGNSNTAKTIELTVLRRGDVVRDNKVNMFDYLYIARYTVGLEHAPDELVAGTIPADSHNGVNMLDALYIARHTVHLESAP